MRPEEFAITVLITVMTVLKIKSTVLLNMVSTNAIYGFSCPDFLWSPFYGSIIPDLMSNITLNFRFR
jgi:hypothetical protein